ncbi:MAG TPA: hypothetical protein VJ623_03155 [Holophagaceae bacterium]|nr:hypothetical protein [Holophagaceae bacterium]
MVLPLCLGILPIAACMGAFFGRGGIPGFASLRRHVGLQGAGSFLGALVSCGVGITGLGNPGVGAWRLLRV